MVKSVKRLVIIFLLSLFGLISCDKDNISPDNVNNNFISCIINGEKWISEGTYFGIELGPFRKQLRIYGFKNSDTLEFILKFLTTDSIQAVSYDLGLEVEKIAIYHHNNNIDTSYSGFIKFDIIDENFPIKAKGTFSFELNSKDGHLYKFQDGKFNSSNN